MFLHNKELVSLIIHNAGVNAPCTNTVMYLRYRDSIAYTTEMTPFYIQYIVVILMNVSRYCMFNVKFTTMILRAHFWKELC